MKLIINADDYGLTKGVSRGIRELLNHQIIRSTTVMINYVTQEDLEKLAQIPNISVGLHFVLNAGKACHISELTDKLGNFKYKANELSIVPKEVVRKELVSQYERLAHFIKVTHIDSHYHTHLKNKNVLEVVQEFAKEKGIKYREAANKFQVDSIQNGTRGLINGFFGTQKDLDEFPEKLKEFTEFEIYDMMCHPGYNDKELMAISSYNDLREYEMTKLKEFKDVEQTNYE